MEKTQNLYSLLGEIIDPRRRQGQRYPCASLLIIIIMCALNNKFGYREISNFCKNNRRELIAIFKFKNGLVPSHVTFRSFIRALDFKSLQTVFHKWTKDYVKIEFGEWINIDGKCIRSTVSDCCGEHQNFVSLVSLFCSKREQVLLVAKFENKTGSESRTVEQLLDLLNVSDAVLTLDALHCKKNFKKNRSKRQSLYSEG